MFGQQKITSYKGLLNDFKATKEWATLTAGQQDFAVKVLNGESVALVGSAGTGKSYVVKILHAYMTRKGKPFAKAATTGVAALNIGGQTVHSFAGLGFGDDSVEALIAKIRKSAKVMNRLRKTRTLLIDEVSMAKGDLLNKLDSLMKHFRDSTLPFGGCQMIFVADFLQLPPVWKGDEDKEFAFACRAWRDAKVKVVNLTEIMRQIGDPTFARALNRIRVGDSSDLSAFKACVNRQFPQDGIEPVRLFCKNVDVDSYNRERLAKIDGKTKTFKSRDNGAPHHIEYFNKHCPAPAMLELRVGAQVMLLRNLDVAEGLVNGSIGIVQAFNGQGGVDVKFTSGAAIVEDEQWEVKEQDVDTQGNTIFRVVATRSQMPLRVCYALSVHKAQGATLDRAVVDLTGVFVAGQCYTALSRVRSLDSLCVIGLERKVVRADPECLAFYESIDLAPAEADKVVVEEELF